MKRIFALSLIAALAGCGGGGGGGNNTATTSSASTPAATALSASAPAATSAPATATPPATTTQPVTTPAIGLQATYTATISTGGGDTYSAPTPSTVATSGYVTADQNQRSIVVGNFGGNNCPAILEAASYDANLPQFPVVAWTSDCAGHYTLNPAVFSGTAPKTGFIVASFAGDFNNTGKDSVLLIDSGNEIPDANGNFPGTNHNTLLLNVNGKLVDMSSTNLPSEGVNYNHVSTVYNLNAPGKQTLVLTRFGGQQFAGGGIEFQVNDGTGNFVADLTKLPPELAYTATSKFDGTVDYVLPGTATLADLDNSGTPYLITGTYANGTYLSHQNALFIYKLVNGVYQKYATLPIPTAYANTLYSAGQTGSHLGVSSIVAGDFEGTGHPDIAALWEGSGITRLQVVHNDGAGNFTDITPSNPVLDIVNSQGNVVAGVTNLHAADVDGDGKDELLLQTYDAAALQSMYRTSWSPVMHIVSGSMVFENIFGGADVNGAATQLGTTVTDPINFMYGNFGTGKLDLMVNVWGPSTVSGAWTLTNDRTFRIFLHE